jgi:hypothetical protein
MVTTQLPDHQIIDTNRSRPRARLRLAVMVAAVALAASACSSGPGTEAEFVDILTKDETITDEQAQCIAGAVFDEYEGQGDALGLISAAESFESLEGENGVPGFSAFLDETVQSCVAFGP